MTRPADATPTRQDLPLVRLDTLCANITDGKHGDCENEPGSGYYFLSCKDIHGGRLNYEDAREITKADFEDSNRRTMLEPSDIVLTNSGTIGRIAMASDVAITRRTTFQKSVAIIKTRGDLVDAPYLMYALQYEMPALIALAGGTAQKNLLLRDMRAYEVALPTLDVQRKIAAILSAYDDLIENNNRRIKLLEEMAQRIYREWFVDFRYPGHENVPLVDSELGPIPEGWCVSPVGDVTPILGGGTPSKLESKYWQDGTITWFTPTDLTSAGAMFVSSSKTNITEQGLAQSSARKFPAGSVMMTSRATIGVVAITTVPATTNQGFITCPATEKAGTFHIYFWLVEQRPVITSLASGATFKEINKATFRQIPFLQANPSIERQFESLLEPIGREIQNLLKAEGNLRSTRDLLLPLLICGEIDVRDLDIPIPEAAA